MWKMMNKLFAAAGDEGTAAGGGAAAGGDAGAAAAAASALAAGAAPAAGGAAAGAGAGQEWLPEKYRVNGADGKLDVEASSRKMAEGYGELSKKLGAGAQGAPAKPEDYKLEGLPESIKADEFKADPKMQEFLKSAHAKGLSNEAVNFVVGEYAKLLPELVAGTKALDKSTAMAELGKSWKSEADMNGNLRSAYRAFQAFASPEDREKMDEIGNNPVVVRMLANIGKELQEDTPIHGQAVNGASFDEQLAKLKTHPGYSDGSHPEHKLVMQQKQALYSKRYGTNKQKLNGGRTQAAA